MGMNNHPLVAIQFAGVPLVAFETTDPAATMKSCIAAIGEKRASECPIVSWNVVDGQTMCNEAAKRLTGLFGQSVDKIQEPFMFLAALAAEADAVVPNSTPPAFRATGSLVFVHNAHLFFKSETFIQAVWNLRDKFKALPGTTLVMLCPQANIPAELVNDVVVVSEPLPTRDEVKAIVVSVAADAGVELKPAVLDKVVDTLLGVSAFAAEQIFAMSISEKGVDFDRLWAHKRKMVEQTPGLSLRRGSSADQTSIGGLENAKRYLKRFLTSKRNPVRCIGFMDEIEKLLGGAAGDLSGVSQDQLQVILTEMQDENIPAFLLLGPPGTGKTALGHYAASVADSEFVKIDTGAMTGALVGESQQKIRHAFRTLKAIGQGKFAIIATCNSIAALPPELRRRFSMGTFFVDLPDKDERAAIWKIWMRKFEFDEDTLRPDDAGWTGAEIKACCEIAWRMEVSLLEASKYIVPVSVSAGDRIEALRQNASGKYISASKDGKFEVENAGKATGRAFQVKQVTTVAEVKQPNEEQ